MSIANRYAQFSKELRVIYAMDYYDRDATCLLSRAEICEIIKLLATE